MTERPLPDLHRVLDRLFGGSKTVSPVAGHALFEGRKRAPGPQSSRRPGEALWKRLLSRKQGPCVGIDLGTGAVKLVRLDHSDGQWKISGAVCEEYPRDLSDDERAGFLAEKLQEFRRNGLLAGRVAFAISDDRVTVESMTLPKMPPGDLSKAVVWEARERMGADPSTHCIRHLLVEERQVEGQSQLEILVFVVPRKEVVPAVEAISSQGCRVVASEPGILAVAAALEEARMGKPEGFWAVLDIGARHSSLVCMMGGQVRFVRAFSIAGEAMTRSIAEYCKMDPDSAEQKKLLQGLDPPDAAPIGTDDLPMRINHAMVMHLDRLITEVDQSLRYVAYYAVERGRAAPLDKLYLTGGGALLKGLPKFMESRLNVKVEAVDSLPEGKFPGDIPPARLIAAMGLASRLKGDG